MKKLLLLVCSLFFTLNLLGSANANPITTDLPANTYISWNGLDWTWASPVSEVNWGGGDILSGPSLHNGWRFATSDEWTPFFNLDGNTRLSLFTDISGGYIQSVAYWNTNFTHVDPTNMSGGEISSAFGGSYFEMIYVRGGQNPVPEPATMVLFGLGLLGLAGVSRKQK